MENCKVLKKIKIGKLKKKLLKIGVLVLLILSVISYFYWVLPVWGIPFNEDRKGY